MTTLYRDRWIECTDDAVHIHGYYFPWGTKRVPYSAIRTVRRVPIGTLTGQGRIWGSTTLRYWANLDPGRPGKRTAPILPFITPDDPAAVEAVIVNHSSAEAVTGPPVIA